MNRTAEPLPGVPRRLPEKSPPLSARAKARLGWEIVATYVRVRRTLRDKGLPTTVRALRERSPGPTRLDELRAWERGHRMASAVNRTVGALPTDGRCLNRSLVLLAMLAERGIDTTLVIGTRSHPAFEAHAWVEHAGFPLLPDGGSEYGRLIEI
jgi:hypothetical protein